MPRISVRSFAHIALAVAAVAAAAELARDATVNAFARHNADLSLRLDPTDPRALATIFNARLAAAGTGAKPLGAQDIAAINASLKSAPLNADLLRVLGVSHSLTENAADARALVLLAARVSQRDVLTQLWLIEDAVSRDNIPEAMAHYDAALSTSTEVRPTLFATLDEALSEPVIRRAIAKYIAIHRPWTDEFLGFAVANSTPADVVALLKNAGVVRSARLRSKETDLLGRLAGTGDIRAARSFALLLPSVNPETLSDLHISTATTDPDFAPLTWRLSNDGPVQAAVDGEGHLQVSAAPNTEGVAGFRTLALASGNYRFSALLSATDSSLPSSVAWNFACVAPDRTEALPSLRISPRVGDQLQSVDIAVSKGCSGIRIELVVRGNDGAQNSDLLVKSMDLRKLAD